MGEGPMRAAEGGAEGSIARSFLSGAGAHGGPGGASERKLALGRSRKRKFTHGTPRGRLRGKGAPRGKGYLEADLALLEAGFASALADTLPGELEAWLESRRHGKPPQCKAVGMRSRFEGRRPQGKSSRARETGNLETREKSGSRGRPPRAAASQSNRRA